MFTCFRKQNINFLEILFTPYVDVNPLLAHHYSELYAKREDIARLNPYQGLRAMVGHLMEKYHAFEHPYPSIIDKIERYGYDGKQVHHLLRVDDYLGRYIAGERYADCLRPTPAKVPRMMDYKLLDKISLEEAREEAREVLAHIDSMAEDFCSEIEEKEDPACRELLQEVSYLIMRESMKKEIL